MKRVPGKRDDSFQLPKDEKQVPISCADPESFVRGGPTLTTFFFKFDEGRKDPNTTISRPSSAR